MITNIGTVAVYVENQQKAKEFWVNKAGFEVIAEHPMGPEAVWLEVAPQNAKTRLVIYPRSMMKDYENKRVSIVFECENVLETYEKMKANGVDFKEEPKEMQWGTYAQFIDEEGNEFLIKG
jgi:lactoylglutathione lyase